ncbi:MAG: PAS domain-containing protein [Verrucomicrobiota bacterium]
MPARPRAKPPAPLQISFEAWRMLLHPEDRERAVTTWEDYLAQRSGIYDQEFRMQQPDGSYRWGAYARAIRNKARRLRSTGAGLLY